MALLVLGIGDLREEQNLVGFSMSKEEMSQLAKDVLQCLDQEQQQVLHILERIERKLEK